MPDNSIIRAWWLACACYLISLPVFGQEDSKARGALTASVGHSQERGFIAGVGTQFENLFGGALNGSIEAERNDFGYRLDAELNTRKTVKVPFTQREGRLSFSIFSEVDDRETNAFNTERTGLRAGLRFSSGESSAVRLGYVLYQDNITDVAPTAFELIADTAGRETGSGLEFGWLRSTLDDPVLPTHGTSTALDFQVLGLGGDAEWVSVVLSASAYTPLSDKGNLRLSFSSGLAQSYSDGELRITDRAFIGGRNPRGFAYRGIGPRFIDVNQDIALGGESYVTATAEYAHDFGAFGSGELRGLVFADVGSVWSLERTNFTGGTIDDSLIWRSAVGLGLTFSTDLGVFSVFVAEAVDQEEFDETQPLSFSMKLRF